MIVCFYAIPILFRVGEWCATWLDLTLRFYRAELIVYRKSALFASGQTMPVLIDGKEEGQLYNSSYLQQPITPGQHFIKITTGMFGKPGEAIIQLAAGERKFLHFDFPTGPLANGFSIGVTLDERGEAEALEDLKELGSARPLAAGKQN